MYMKIYKRKRENINLDQDINHISYNPNDNLLSSSPFLLFSLSLSLSLSLSATRKKKKIEEIPDAVDLFSWRRREAHQGGEFHVSSLDKFWLKVTPI